MATNHIKRGLAAVLAVAALFTGALALADGPATGATDSRVPSPLTGVYLGKGDKCVEPTADMRRNHMKYILHQRNLTMHEGIRTQRFLLTNCVDCHADPKTHTVLGKNGFCASCHAYAAVKIDCFSCHSPSPENTATAPGAPVAAGGSRLVEMVNATALAQTWHNNADGQK
ncbi:MAG: hypothetical protein ACYDDO_00850 [Acidiferrobacterales bacterium]